MDWGMQQEAVGKINKMATCSGLGQRFGPAVFRMDGSSGHAATAYGQGSPNCAMVAAGAQLAEPMHAVLTLLQAREGRKHQ